MLRRNRVFYFLFLSSLLLSAVYLALRRGAGLEGFLFQGGNDLFADFTNNLHYPTHENGPYYDSCWASFPPLAFTFYYLLNVCLTRANFYYEVLAYTMITGLTCVVIFYAVEQIFRRYSREGYSSRETLLLTLCLLLSGAVIYAVERGNSALNVLALLLLSFALRQSPSLRQREAALWLIALAAGLKIYPCLFGLVYLFEKRYREAFRLLLYGLVLFFVPFLWFGGWEGMALFFENQMALQSSLRTDTFTSIPSIFSYLAREWNGNAATLLPLGRGIAYALGALLALCAAVEKRLWLRVTLLVCLMIVVPGWSGEYTAMYLALPFLLFYCDPENTPLRGLYLTLFSFVFILLPFTAPLKTHSPLSWNVLFSFGAIYLLCFLGIGDALTTWIRARRRGQETRLPEAKE